MLSTPADTPRSRKSGLVSVLSVSYKYVSSLDAGDIFKNQTEQRCHQKPPLNSAPIFPWCDKALTRANLHAQEIAFI